MAVLARFTVASTHFPFGAISERLDTTVELDRIIPTDDRILPYFWIQGVEVEEVMDTLEKMLGVESFEHVDKVEDWLLFRVAWAGKGNRIIGAIVESEVTLLSGTGNGKQWMLEVRADDHSVLTDFQRRVQILDIPFTLEYMGNLDGAEAPLSTGLTDAQEEAVDLALNRGYYREPRETTLDELGAELGISRQSVSSRLRRAHGTLVERSHQDKSPSKDTR